MIVDLLLANACHPFLFVRIKRQHLKHLLRKAEKEQVLKETRVCIKKK